MDKSTKEITDTNLSLKEATSNTSKVKSAEFPNKNKEKQINAYILLAAAKQLEEIIKENMSDKNIKYIKKDLFYLNPPPKISIYDFLKGITLNTDIDISTIVCGVIYIDRMCEKRNYVLCFNNIHLLIIAACILSMKFNEDYFVRNLNMAQFHGVHVELVNQIEYEFYVLIDFNLYIEESLFKKYYVYFYKVGKKYDLAEKKEKAKLSK
ncbi:MAG: hypothetical protein MJ252_27870 [archaeon]|nr:hypothetical protein [archaeon]